MTNYSVTIYIAGPGTTMQGGGTSTAGHMWYSLSGDTRSYGFAPKEPGKDTALPVEGERVDDDTAKYQNPSYSRTYQLSEQEHNKLKEFGELPFANGFDKSYWAGSNSCVDFVWKALDHAGLNTGKHQGSLLPLANRDDLDRFMKLPIGEQQQLTKYLNNLFPLTALTGEFEQQDVMCTKLQAQFKTALTVAIDPLVLDLDGDGVETTTLSKTSIGGVNFNLDAKGLAEKTGWVGKDDGLLVRDLDGDGQITSGRELFGNHALLQSGKAAAHGFEALKELDSNADGVVDAKDSAFATLKVWKDADSDGVTDAGELLTLDEAGVKSLKVGYSNANTIDAQGNAHRQLGSFTTTGGVTREMNDVWFGVDTARSLDQDMVSVSANIAALPELAGMGNVRSLRQAMARDSSGQLENLVQQWTSGSPSQRAEIVDQLIYVWAGVQDVNPTSRGTFMDARKLSALEAFLGSDFTRNSGNPSNQIIANPLKEAYALLSESVVERLYWQTDAVPLLGNVSLTWVPGDVNATHNSEAAEGHFSYQAVGLVKALNEEFSSKTIGYGVQDLLLFMSVLKKNGGEALLQAMQADAAAYDGLFKTLLQSQGDSAALSQSNIKIGTHDTDTISAAAGNASVLLGMLGDDALYGGNKDDVLDGGAGNDTLNGGDGSDTLLGREGADTLNGGFGNDTYIFNKGDGVDAITDYDYSAGNVDTLVLGAGLTAAEAVVGRTGNDLTLSWGADSMVVKDYFYSSYYGNYYQVEAIHFADGPKWNSADIAANLVQNGTTNADSIYGLSDYANKINGLDGNDNLNGGNKDDVLDGGAGNDTLNGGDGSDSLLGGVGNDMLRGGYGNDTYSFNKGDGVDTIGDWDYAAGNVDTLMLGGELNATDAVVRKTGNDLTLSWGADSVIVQNYFYNKANQVEAIQFADAVGSPEGPLKITLADVLQGMESGGLKLKGDINVSAFFELVAPESSPIDSGLSGSGGGLEQQLLLDQQKVQPVLGAA